VSQNYTPRKATEADLADIEALVSSAYEKYVVRIGRKPKPMVADYRKALAHHELWVLEHDQSLIAVLELIANPEHLLIENIAVSPRCQGSGIGRRLMQFAESEARRRGYREIRLYTNERFTENITIYSKLGYRETRREQLPEAVVVHMAKSVHAQVYQETSVEIVRRANVVSLSNSGVTSEQLLCPKNSRSERVTITRVTVAPGAKNPRHVHVSSEQVWVALHGAAQLLLDGSSTAPFGEGDVVRFVAGDVHGLENHGAEEFVYLSVTSPPIDFRTAYSADWGKSEGSDAA
jgi:N-acetylglutamate synthase-like GNAT family acetyltransferase